MGGGPKSEGPKGALHLVGIVDGFKKSEELVGVGVGEDQSGGVGGSGLAEVVEQTRMGPGLLGTGEGFEELAGASGIVEAVIDSLIGAGIFGGQSQGEGGYVGVTGEGCEGVAGEMGK